MEFFKYVSDCCGKNFVETHPVFLIPTGDATNFRVAHSDYPVSEKEFFYLPKGYAYSQTGGGPFIQAQISVPLLESGSCSRSPNVILPTDSERQIIKMEVQDHNSIGVSRLANFLFQRYIKEQKTFQQYDSIRYINENLDRSLSIDQLAAIEHYSVPYYKEWFKMRVGVPPSLYIRTQRLERAKELLVQMPEATIIDIAMAVGYSDNAAFTKAFSLMTGYTPSHYRKMKRHCTT